MKGIAIELHHEPPICPQSVDLEAIHPGVDGRRGQPLLATKIEKEGLELRASRRRREPLVGDQRPERAQPVPSRIAVTNLLYRAEIEDPLALGFIHNSLELPRQQHLGEVEEGAGHRSHGNTLVHRPIGIRQPPHLVEKDAAVPTMAAARRRDLDTRRGRWMKVV